MFTIEHRHWRAASAAVASNAHNGAHDRKRSRDFSGTGRRQRLGFRQAWAFPRKREAVILLLLGLSCLMNGVSFGAHAQTVEEISVVTPSTSVDAGGAFTVEWSYSASGGTTGDLNSFTINLHYCGDDGSSCSSGDELLCGENYAELCTHEDGICVDSDGSYNVTVPADTPPGKYSVMVTLVQDSSVASCSSAFNVTEAEGSAAAAAVGEPSLEVLYPANNLVEGIAFTAQWVYDNGTGEAEGTFEVNLKLCDSESGDCDDEGCGTLAEALCEDPGCYDPGTGDYDVVISADHDEGWYKLEVVNIDDQTSSCSESSFFVYNGNDPTPAPPPLLTLSPSAASSSVAPTPETVVLPTAGSLTVTPLTSPPPASFSSMSLLPTSPSPTLPPFTSVSAAWYIPTSSSPTSLLSISSPPITPPPTTPPPTLPPPTSPPPTLPSSISPPPTLPSPSSLLLTYPPPTSPSSISPPPTLPSSISPSPSSLSPTDPAPTSPPPTLSPLTSLSSTSPPSISSPPTSPPPTSLAPLSPPPSSILPTDPLPTSPPPTSLSLKSPSSSSLLPTNPPPTSPSPTSLLSTSPPPTSPLAISPAPTSPAPISPPPSSLSPTDSLPTSPPPTSPPSTSPFPASPSPTSPPSTLALPKTPSPTDSPPTGYPTPAPVPMIPATLSPVSSTPTSSDTEGTPGSPGTPPTPVPAKVECDPSAELEIVYTQDDSTDLALLTVAHASGDLSEAGCLTLTMLYEWLGSDPAGVPATLLYTVDPDSGLENPNYTNSPTGTWLLRTSVEVTNGVTFSIKGSAVDGDCDELKIYSTVDMWYRVMGHGGNIDIDSTLIRSWDTMDDEEHILGDEADGKTPRSYIACVSEVLDDDETCDGTSQNDMGECRMDIVNSELGYLGYDETEAYGITWKVRGLCEDLSNVDTLFDNVRVYGDMSGSNIHHMWYGMYSYGHLGGVWNDNLMHDNHVYGFDPHDDSDYLTIQNNTVWNNGNHGIIASKRCDHLRISDNEVHNNDGSGIMLHKSCDDSIVEGNNCTYNFDAGVSLVETSRCSVKNNAFGYNRWGFRVILGSTDNVLERNLLTANRYSDIYAYYGAVEEVPDVSPYTGINVNNIFRDNVVNHVVKTVVDIEDSNGTEISSNIFSGEDGYFVFLDSSNTHVVDNTGDAASGLSDDITDSCFTAESERLPLCT